MHLRRNREIGGAERYILLVAGKLDASKYDTVVAAFGYLDDPRVALIRSAEEQGVQVETIRPLGRYNPLCVSELAGLLKKHRVDLLHTHDHKSTLAGILAGLLGLKFGISPVVELTPISDEGTEPLPPVETDEGISPIDGMGEACSDPSGKAALVSPELLPLERL